MNTANSGYLVYMLHGLPTGLFGESYVVVTGSEASPNRLWAEHFILTQRPHEALRAGTLEIAADTFPAELGVIDTDFAMEQGLRQAEIDLQEMLEVRCEALDRPDLTYLPIELKARPSPFVGCKMRGRFLAQVEEMRALTQCRPLKLYLELLQQVSVV